MNYNFCIIGNKKNPFISNLFDKLKRNNVEINKIVLEKNNFSKKDFRIFRSRISSAYRYNFLENRQSLKEKIIFVKDLNDLKTSRIVSKNKIDWLMQMGVNKIMKKALLKAPKKGIINCHPGILPFFRGCCPVEWSVLLGQNIGVTTHIMGKDIDSGKIISTKKISYKKIRSYKNLRTKILNLQFSEITKNVIKIDKNLLQLKNLKRIDKKKGFYFKPINNFLLQLVKKKLRYR